MLLLEFADKKTIATDASTRDALRRGFFGKIESKVLVLEPEEAMYLVDMRNAECMEKGKRLRFNELVQRLGGKGKLMTRYHTYKDWRERGLVIKPPGYAIGEEIKAAAKKYPATVPKYKNYKLTGVFFPDDMVTVIDDPKKGKEIYEEHWMGQYGTYKLIDKGVLNKLDAYETVFLIKRGQLHASNMNLDQIISAAEKHRPDFQKLYDVYEDWASKGYVVKTGFKFGTQFRIYFPGTKPNAGDGNWTHSMHVLHVFPRDVKLLTSEFARVIRVAHSVRKTFILAIPGKSREKKIGIDFVLYHRKDGNIETPEHDSPRYAMLSLSEDEYIGGTELSAAINEAGKNRMELILAISDRETAVTYYLIRRIELPRSSCEYYEIDWMQP